MRSLKLLGLLVVLSVPAQGMITKSAKFTKKFSNIKNTSLSYSQDKVPFKMTQGNRNPMHTPLQFMNTLKFQKFHSTPIQIAIKSSDVIQKQPKIAKYLSLIKQHKAPKLYYINPQEVHVMQNGVGGAQVGWHIGWWGTHVVCHGTIFVGCRIADFFAPGVGAAAEKGLHVAAQPYILIAAKTIACGSAIAGATATGPA